ncbi:MAG: alpha-hydroxy-acid oxidizing protein [Gemmatimonadetes bacterium]|nr:alpha-hydroxy-acid oxidizing protein [Gemmatimonadota bacterium]
MTTPRDSRRRFLAFLAGSPLFAAAGVDPGLVSDLLRGGRRADRDALDLVEQLPSQDPPITRVQDALDVFDFEPVAKKAIPVAHWGYLAGGTDDDATIAANRAGFDRWVLNPRRLIDVSRIDASLSFYGTKYPTPIVINPVASQKAFHAQGEVAVARAARAKDHLMVLSTVATTSIEEAIAERGGPVWFQLYHQPDWSVTKQMVQRAERAGAPAIVFTVDLLAGSNRLTLLRESRKDTRECTRCHLGGPPLPGLTGRLDDRDNRRKPMLNGYDALPPQLEVGTPTWEFVDRLKQSTRMKVLLKGIVTEEDAALAVKHGVDGLFVSNHGGRAENSQRATITSLPEVVKGARGRIPLICDGGFRRGTDVFKAIALGATAVGIGRPYVWGLGAFGQEGVEAVLTILRKEFELIMKQSGTTTLAQVSRRHIAPA